MLPVVEPCVANRPQFLIRLPRTRRVPGRRRQWQARALLALLAWTSGALTIRDVHAAEAPPPLVLSAQQQAALAEAFAPMLVFHQVEGYFPTSPMSPLGVGAEPENWPERVTEYRALSLEAKLRRSALAYRVFTRIRRGETEVVVEYWCYYVYNTFTVRGGWLPYRVDGNHPHDLERLYVVLTPTRATSLVEGPADETWARGGFEIRSVIANAHDGSIPPNQYDVPDGDTLDPPLSVLVELGSHAMAPDLNRDGRFTPGVDSTAILKLQWGIRDRGATWGRYRASFMDDRDGSAVRLCPPTTTAPEANMRSCSRYALYPAGDLQRWFDGLRLSARERREVLGQTPWLIRTFGDVRVEELMVPTDPANGRVLDAMLRRTRSEAGLIGGFTTVAHAPTVVVGGRHVWAVRSPRAPDVMTEAVALLPIGRRRLVEATIWGSYSVDAITNALFGVGAFSEGLTLDFVAGVDLRIGRFRVRPTWRLREGGFGSRVTTTF